jgi:hypothetical protein
MARYVIRTTVTQIFDDSGGTTTRESAETTAKANITIGGSAQIVASRIGKSSVLNGDAASPLNPSEAANVLSERYDAI